MNCDHSNCRQGRDCDQSWVDTQNFWRGVIKGMPIAVALWTVIAAVTAWVFA